MSKVTSLIPCILNQWAEVHNASKNSEIKEYRLMEMIHNLNPKHILLRVVKRNDPSHSQWMSFLDNNAVTIEKQVSLNLYKMSWFHLFRCSNLDEFISKFGKLWNQLTCHLFCTQLHRGQSRSAIQCLAEREALSYNYSRSLETISELLGARNIARIANAVHVTLTVSNYYYPTLICLE